jgi:hypothetical protein
MRGRWLLDANVPVQMVRRLSGYGLVAETTSERGWNSLVNGKLLEAAATNGFAAILTRDRLFGESASKARKKYSQIGIVILTLPQLRAAEFDAAFVAAWSRRSIKPEPGEIIEWP